MKIQPKSPITPSDRLSTDFPFRVGLLSDDREAFPPLRTGAAHCHEYFEIIFVLQGSGTLKVDMQEYDINKNGIYCIYPGQIHLLHASEKERLAGYTLKFKKSFAGEGLHKFDLTYSSGLLQLLASRQGIPVSESLAEDLRELLVKMMAELRSPGPLKLEIVRNYLEIFLIQVTRQHKSGLMQKTKTKNMELVEKFLALLEQNYKEKKMVADYAADLCITPNYLNEIVKKTTGSPAGCQIRQRIALEAKRQALYSRLGMKEIAYFLGFSDPSHFSKFFKNETGENFSDFKQQNAVISLPEAV